MLWSSDYIFMRLALLCTLLCGALGAPTPEQLQRLQSWVEEGGGFVDGVELAVIDGFGAGVRATRALARGEEIVSIPRELFFVPTIVPGFAAAIGSGGAAEVLDAVESNQLLLACALLYHRKVGRVSHMGPYLDLLPNEFTCVPSDRRSARWRLTMARRTTLYMPDEMMVSTLHEPLRRETQRRREALEQVYGMLRPALEVRSLRIPTSARPHPPPAFAAAHHGSLLGRVSRRRHHHPVRRSARHAVRACAGGHLAPPSPPPPPGRAPTT